MCAAVGYELQENIEELELIQEYSLSKEPIRIDLLIIKDGVENFKIKNEIGHIMRKYNVIEYKSPDDTMCIDDFYKTIGYACLYKGYGDYVDKIRTSELTVSLFSTSYPRELFKALETEGLKISEVYSGIYYVTGTLPFPVQVIVIKRLDKRLHSCLRILTNSADKDDVENFLREVKNVSTSGGRNNVDSVLQASVSANQELYEEVRRDAVMCQALEELMKDVIDERVDSAVNSAMNEAANKQFESNVETIKNIMDKFRVLPEQAMDLLNIPQQSRSKYLEKL
jgi:hypothetical protein